MLLELKQIQLYKPHFEFLDKSIQLFHQFINVILEDKYHVKVLLINDRIPYLSFLQFHYFHYLQFVKFFYPKVLEL